uniref:Chemotaxis protein n=1 Tax=Pseudomonas syringae TaxID=317 RepID=I3W0H6_PSESX|nr:hypothetical protein [Pseudomonas syringae]AFK89103.1 hypothetical protein [Pseudomonas syringae]
MIAINTQTSSLSQLSAQLVTDRKPVEAVQESTDISSTSAPPEGVKVSLSSAGIQKAADDKDANPNADIESSGLPDQAQKILKMIREIQQKIEQKQQELQAIMADDSMDPDTKQSRVGVIQSELATLTASLTTANNSLDKLSNNGAMSSAQSQQAAQLAMKK